MTTAQLSLDVFQPCEPQTNLPYCTFETLFDLTDYIIGLVSTRFKDNNRVSLTPDHSACGHFGWIKLQENKKGGLTGDVMLGINDLKQPHKIQASFRIKGNKFYKAECNIIPAADNPKLYVALGDVMRLDGWIFDTFVHECNKRAKTKKGKPND